MELSDFELARALLTHLRAAETEKDQTFWAWEHVEEMIDLGRVEEAWRVIASAIEQAITDRDFMLIGAGVLESLVMSHPVQTVAELVERVKNSPKVARAVRSMYLDDLTDDQAEAIRRVVAEVSGNEPDTRVE